MPKGDKLGQRTLPFYELNVGETVEILSARTKPQTVRSAVYRYECRTDTDFKVETSGNIFVTRLK